MSTVALKCPLCCDERFPTYESLKYHILAVAENILCPACDNRFDSILELADHIGSECREKDSAPVDMDSSKKQPVQVVADPMYSIEETPHLEANPEAEEVIEQQMEEHIAESVLSDDTNMNGECAYMCEMCNMEFTNIEEHLEKYHEGEDVIVENEDDRNRELQLQQEELQENPEEELQPPEAEEGNQTNNFEIMAENPDSPNDLDMEMPFTSEEEVLADEVASEGVTDKTTGGIDEFWVNEHSNEIPITEFYVMGLGGIEKISEEAASRIEDRNSVIEIHQCPRCYLQFPKMDHYVKHLCNPDRNNDNFKCAHCSAVFHTYQSLNAHMRMHIPKDADAKEKRIVTLGPHMCEVCSSMFPSFKSMKLHQRMHDPKAIADKCRGAVTPDAAAKAATATGVTRQMFVCNICAMTYDKQYEEIHMRSHKGEENYNCTTCNRKFHTKENLEMHARAHAKPKKFICSYCKKPFATNDALQEHVNDECRDRDYACQYCGRRFTRPHERLKHERIHTGERPHVCQICGKGFRVSYCLTLHLRTHTGHRPYECKQCGKRFKAQGVYNHHLLTHSDVRAYKCNYCPKAFKTSVQLAGHRNSHTKPFTCKECNRPFASLYAVRAHMETHKRDNNLKFECYVCGATYARDFALRDHLKSQHPEESDDTATAGVVEVDATEEAVAQIEQEMDAEDS